MFPCWQMVIRVMAVSSIMIEGGQTPLLTTAELNEMGFKLVAFAVSCLLAATKAMQRAMKVLKEEGTTRAIVTEMTNFGDFNDLIGFPEVRAFEAKYRIKRKEATNG